MRTIQMMAAAVLIAAAPMAAWAQESINLYFDTPSRTGPLNVGDTFTIAAKTDIVGYSVFQADFSVSWNPAVLEHMSRELGPEWISPMDLSNWGDPPPPGSVYFTCLEYTTDPQVTNFSTGTHTIVTYTFRVVGAGNTEISFGIHSLSAPTMTDNIGTEFPADPVTNGQYPAPVPVKILSVSAPTLATVGDLVTLSADVKNDDSVPQDVSVDFGGYPLLFLGTVTANVGVGQTMTLTYSWHTESYEATTYPLYAALNGKTTDFAPMLLNSREVASDGNGGGAGCRAGTEAGNLAPLLLALVALTLWRALA